MPQLTFPIPAGELTLSVLIGLNGHEAAARVAAGQPIPRPVWTAGVIDTATNVTCVTATVLQKLGLSATGQARSQTAGGPVLVDLFEVSLSIPPPGNVPGPMLARSLLTVMELTAPIPGVEVLIGMDILLDCRLFIDGPGRQFTLDF